MKSALLAGLIIVLGVWCMGCSHHNDPASPAVERVLTNFSSPATIFDPDEAESVFEADEIGVDGFNDIGRIWNHYERMISCKSFFRIYSRHLYRE
jgi:hypothetical protein